MKLTPAVIRDCHRLRDEGKSVREIAVELHISKSTVHRALQVAAPLEVPTVPKARQPILVHRVHHAPTPLPLDADPMARRLHAVLVRQQLWGELDALTIFFGLDVPRVRPVVNTLDVDSFLHRL